MTGSVVRICQEIPRSSIPWTGRSTVQQDVRSATLISERTREAPLPWAPVDRSCSARGAPGRALVVELDDCRTLARLPRCGRPGSLWAGAWAGPGGGCSASELADPPRRAPYSVILHESGRYPERGGSPDPSSPTRPRNPGELLAAARGLARSGDWAADAIVAGRVRWHLRRKFGADTVSALFDRPPADVDPLAGILTLDTIGSIEPAETRARGLLWSGKLGVLHGGAGCGKTTLAAGVVSAITAGLDWMGHGTTATDVLVLSGEDVDTLRARVDQWGGDPTRVHVWPDPDPGKVAEAVEATGAGAVVVDSLQSWARGLGLNLNDDAEAGTPGPGALSGCSGHGRGRAGPAP